MHPPTLGRRRAESWESDVARTGGGDITVTAVVARMQGERRWPVRLHPGQRGSVMATPSTVIRANPIQWTVRVLNMGRSEPSTGPASAPRR